MHTFSQHFVCAGRGLVPIGCRQRVVVCGRVPAKHCVVVVIVCGRLQSSALATAVDRALKTKDLAGRCASRPHASAQRYPTRAVASFGS